MSGNKWKLACLLGVSVATLLVLVAQRFGSTAAVRGNTPAARINAISRLTGERPAGAPAAIANAVADPDAQVRRAALLSLATFVRPEDRTIVERALQDSDNSVRAAAAQTLGCYGLQSVPRLAALAQDPDPQVRAGVVAGLGRTGRGPGMAVLVQMMSRRGDPDIQLQALHAIEAICKIRYAEVPDPRNEELWAAQVDKVRRNRWVQEVLTTETSDGAKP